MSPAAFSVAHPLPMPWHWRPAAWLLGVLLGTWVQLLQASLWPSWGYAVLFGAGLAGTLALVCCKALRWLGWDRAVCALAAAVLAFGAAGWRAQQQWQTRLNPQLEGVDLQLQGTVVAMPQTLPLGQRFRMQVQAAWRDGQPVAVPPLVDIAWYGSWPASNARNSAATDAATGTAAAHIVAGQRWRLPVRLKAVHGSANPHGFDYELWMWEQGVQASGYVRLPKSASAGHDVLMPQLLGAGWAHPVEWLRQRVRDAMVRELVPVASAALGGAPSADANRARIAGVLVALVTGEQRAIDREDWRIFRTTGVAHLVAISGLHITLVAWVASIVISAGWRRSARLCLWQPAPRVALIGAMLCALAYAVFSGWGLPAQRTALMLGVVVVLKLSGRQWPWHATWLLACACVVLVQPMALLQAGFWLSFLAVGILFASDFVTNNQYEINEKKQNGFIKTAIQLFKVQCVITVAITPLSLLLFGQVSVVGLLANLFAIVWVTWVITPLALLGIFLPGLWALDAWLMLPLMAWLGWLAQWPHAALWLPAAPGWIAAVAVLGGLVVVLPLPWQVRSLGAPLLLPALWWQPPGPAPGQFSLLALDVGQGQAVLVQTAQHALLYDAGPLYGPGSNAGDRVVVPALRALGAQGTTSGTLDMLVLSHADVDHTGGAQAVVTQLKPAQLLGSLLPHERSRLGIAHAAPWRDCVAGTAWQWDGVHFSVLHPATTLHDTQGSLPSGAKSHSGNSVSCVLRIQAASHKGHAGVALLLGDLEKKQEQQLVKRMHPVSGPATGVLHADVLLVPHHGSNTSSSPALLAAVQPRWAIVQSGYRNRFHHPAAPVVERYRKLEIPLVTTVACGAAHWQSDAPLALNCQRQQSPRYWQHVPENVSANGVVNGVETRLKQQAQQRSVQVVHE